MKGIYHICFILIFYILPSCEEIGNSAKTDVDEIPPRDRFIYSKGDNLTYRCNDGTTNTFLVRDYKFWTRTGIATDMFGGSHPWERDEQRITIESSSNSWQKVLGSIFGGDSFTASCFIIETINTIYDVNGNPYSWVLNGCDEAGSPIFAQGGVKSFAMVLNNNQYEKVYYTLRNNGSNSFTVYWNLKYGIIRFESVIDGKQEIWNLENPKM